MPLGNALFRHEVQLNKAASDKHKRNEVLRFEPVYACSDREDT